MLYKGILPYNSGLFSLLREKLKNTSMRELNEDNLNELFYGLRMLRGLKRGQITLKIKISTMSESAYYLEPLKRRV